MERVLASGRQAGTGRLRLGLVEIILVAAGIVGEPAGIDVHDMIGQGADEIDIVADEDEGALELVEREGQGIDARQVQVRRRFVHEQKVRRVQEQLHQRQAALLAAAQDARLS